MTGLRELTGYSEVFSPTPSGNRNSFTLQFGIYISRHRKFSGISYKGGSSLSRMASNYATDEDSRYVDKNSVVHYDGSPRLAEEYE